MIKISLMKTIIFCAGAPNPHLSIINQYPDALFIGVDAGATALINAGKIPDWAIGDFDSTSPPTQCPQQFILPCEKDETDLVVALKHILSKHPPHHIHQIIILGALGGGRLDHLLANIWLAHDPYFFPWLSKIQFIEQNNSVRFFQAGQHTLLKEHNKKYLSFITLTPITQLTLENVKYPLDKHPIPRPTAWISNEFIQSRMNFSFSDGLICVIQSQDSTPTNPHSRQT